MKVKELITRLQQCNPEAKVYTMAFEDASGALSVWTREENSGEDALYFKSESPSDYYAGDYVIITDDAPKN